MMLEGDVTLPVLAQARSFVQGSLDEARDTLGPGVEENDSDHYGGLTDVLALENDEVFPGTVYVHAGRVDLVYLDADFVPDLTRSALEAEVQGDPVSLRSRAGKKARMHVYAPQGIAFSMEGDQVHFVEVFVPRSQEEYEAQIYREPPEFIR